MFLICAGDNSSSKIAVPILLDSIYPLTSSNLPTPKKVLGFGRSIFWTKRFTATPPAVEVKNSNSSKYSSDCVSSCCCVITPIKTAFSEIASRASIISYKSTNYSSLKNIKKT